MSSSVLEKLRNDSDYYGEYGSQYLSNSDIYALLKKPREFRKSEPTAEMLLGRYFHTLLLEPDKIENFPVAKASTRSTNVFKNMIEETKLGKYDVILEKEADLVFKWAEAVRENFVMSTDIYAKGNEYEVPAVGTLFGTQWKGKADIVTSENVIDLKLHPTLIVGSGVVMITIMIARHIYINSYLENLCCSISLIRIVYV